MSEPHPTPLTLDRASVEDLARAQLDEVRAHVAICERCAAYLAELDRARAQRMQRRPSASFVAELELRAGRGAWRRYAYAAGAIAACVAVLLWGHPPGTRLRGAGPSVFRKRGSEVKLLEASPAPQLRAGDALRVAVALDRRETIGAWFVDEHGRVDALLDAPLALDAGQHELPGSAIVEAPCVDLQLVLSMDGARSDDEVRRVAAQAREHGRAFLLRCEER